MRLIDADKLETHELLEPLGIGNYEYAEVVYKDDIDNAPTIEPERKTGKWIYYDPNGFQCSRCRRYLEISCGDVKMNFCIHCGSYNRGEQE